MIHPSVTDTADVNEFGAVRIPEEILRKLGAGVGDLISFVKAMLAEGVQEVQNKIQFKKTSPKQPQA